MTFNGFYLLNWKYFSLSTLTVGVPTYPPTLTRTSVLGFLLFLHKKKEQSSFSFFNTSTSLASHGVYAFTCFFFFFFFHKN